MAIMPSLQRRSLLFFRCEIAGSGGGAVAPIPRSTSAARTFPSDRRETRPLGLFLSTSMIFIYQVLRLHNIAYIAVWPTMHMVGHTMRSLRPERLWRFGPGRDQGGPAEATGPGRGEASPQAGWASTTLNRLRRPALLGFKTPSDFVRAYPASREWLTLLIRRMDAVASIYRLAASLSPGTSSRRSHVEFHRRGRFDAIVRR